MRIADDPIALEDALPACAICARSSVVTKILRLSLLVRVNKPDSVSTTRGAGGIDLCERCWRVATRDARQHRRRSPRRVAA